MINTQTTITNRAFVSNASGRPERAEESASLPQESFSRGLPGVGPEPTPAICPQPVVGFEPWLMGQPTTDPSVSPKFADKLVRNFGENAILAVDDERIKGCSGYYFQGWEGVSAGNDWLAGVTLGRLGEGWEMTGYGSYELKNGNAGQRLSFDVSNRQTVLESYYVDNTYDTSIHSETLRRDEDGTMRRQHNAPGM